MGEEVKSTFTNYVSSLVGFDAVTTTTPEKIGTEKIEAAFLKDKSLILILDKKGSTFDIERHRKAKSNIRWRYLCSGIKISTEKGSICT